MSGTIGVDDVTIAGIKISKQTFGPASVVYGSPTALEFDGMLGLAFDSNSEIGIVSFLHAFNVLSLFIVEKSVSVLFCSY